MSTRRTILSAAALPFLSACGGSPGPGPHSETSLYDRQLRDLQSASAVVEAGISSLGTWAQEAMLSEPTLGTMRLDPITQQPRWSDLTPGNAYRYWFVAASVVDAGGKPVATSWQPRTIWVLKGAEYISSRDLRLQDSVFLAAFPQPPFARDGVIVVVELIQGGQTRLYASPPTWLG
jgi:hypothetical protein